MNIDIVEFIEKTSGLQLLEYQKKILRKIEKLPKDSALVPTRYGTYFLGPKSNVDLVGSPESSKRRGLRAKIMIIDDFCDLDR